MHQQTVNVAGRDIIVETGKLAKQAHGAVTVRAGDTVIMATVVASKEPDTSRGYFPLFVDYREKMYSAGKIPGGFFKREGRPTTKETLTARLIDRSIRPLFPDGFNNEVQVLVQVLSYDQDNDPGILGIIGASAALMISPVPFDGPIAGLAVGRVDEQLVVNPDAAALEAGDLHLVVTGNRNDILMIEGGAKELSEEVMLEAMELVRAEIQPVMDMQEQLVKDCGKPKMEVVPPAVDEALVAKIKEAAAGPMREANVIKEKLERQDAVAAVKNTVKEALGEETYEENAGLVGSVLEELEKKEVRRVIIEDKKRIDGRGMDEIRPITCEVGVLPRTHGSAVFTRGQTQSLGVVTLGTKLDEQRMEELAGSYFKSYMLHYNFPSFSVGETGPNRGPGRREIGHGALAERALEPMLPVEEDFPYTIRIVSDILESNGSSSMASVCSGCLSLMDAGVPIKAPVAGIAMGLIMHDGGFEVLTDIQGAEDHCGDMDFKVTGTREGITAFQMDVKATNITIDVLRVALEKARLARISILDSMQQTIAAPREEMSPYAPRIISLKINPEKIGALIGPGGKVIKAIQEQTGVTINVEDDGTVTIASTDEEASNDARAQVEAITEEVKVGKIYKKCKVRRLMNFGAFVEILPGTDGMVHISELAPYRVAKVEDVVKIGDEVDVKCIEVDDQNRINLSIKQALPPDQQKQQAPAGQDGGRDGHSRPRSGDRPRTGDRHRGPRHGNREDANKGDVKKDIETLNRQLGKGGEGDA